MWIAAGVTSELDLKIIKLGLKQNMEKGTNDGSVMENFADQFMTCSVEVGADKSAGFDSNLLKAEAFSRSCDESRI